MHKIKSNYLFIIITSLLFASLFIYVKFSQPRIAYVKTLEVVYGYNGMKQAHSEYKAQEENWQSNIDTLKWQHQQAVIKYKSGLSDYSETEKKEQEKLITDLEKNVRQYSSTVQQQAKERENEITEGVLNQINSFIEDYAKSKGYDMILGADGSGSVIYGDAKYDITKEVLDALNNDYKPLPDEETPKASKD